MWFIAINGEDHTTAQGVLDEQNQHQTPRVKYNIKISLCRRKRYQITGIEDICSRFDQVRPVVSHLEVCLPKKPPTPNNNGEGLKGPQRQLWKEYLSVKYVENRNVSLLLAPILIKYLPEGTTTFTH